MARSVLRKIQFSNPLILLLSLVLPLLWVASQNVEYLHSAVRYPYREQFTILPAIPVPTTVTGSTNITVTTVIHRFQPIKLSDTKFSYLHISKNSGVSWIRELKKLKQTPEGLPGHYEKMAQLFPTIGLYPIADSGAEHGALFQDDLLQSYRPFHRLLTLRSPRHQIWSMFSHCYYSDWGKRATSKDRHFPRGHENDLIDFELWLNEFLDDSQTAILDDAGSNDQRNYTLTCYHPQNYQSRALTSFQREPRQPERGMIEPNLEHVRESYWSFDWVALTSFFHESKCLLYYRLDTNGTSPEIQQLVSDYLDDTCHCNVNVTVSLDMDIKERHAIKGKRSTLLDLPPSIVHKMDIISRIDIAVYETALDQFVREMVWLESELQRRVLCDPVLETWGQELSYLPLLQHKSLSQRYQAARHLLTSKDPS